ncbi:MAG: Bro-N domain-containing protein [Candidatus Thermoplasmatota archaeon]|nr:Bro-N domain-containing protein [Candidatus Thermoplasmatota archaeon]
MISKEHSLVVFNSKKIRRTWHNNEWWFSVVDIVQVLTDSADPKQYIKKMRVRDKPLSDNWGTICTPLELIAPDGKKRRINCVNVKGAFRLIQSIPSTKAEPFKQWLAKVGYERVEEIQNPELAQKRMKEIYRAKGYSDDWIEKRVRGIAIRDELTDEWKKRDVKTEREYAILTAEISKETFGMTPSEYKKFKRLKRENLRDHMNDLEIIFSMLGERVATEITRNKDAEGFEECEGAAKQGGRVAGNARLDAENRIGAPISTKDNYKHLTEKKKKRLRFQKK